MTQFNIPVIEYACEKGGAQLPNPQKPFLVNDRQLVVSIVRSILTVNSGRTSRKYMAAIVKPTLQFLLDWNRAPNLSVSADFFAVLRDFSEKLRIGELAQGVSYAYWKWQRGYTWIADFGPWAAGLTPPYKGKKSPDFIMLNLITNDLAVMESKGTGLNCPKSAMGKALRQCKEAVAHPSFSRGYGSVLTLDSGNPNGVGTLHLRDPYKPAEVTDKLSYYVFRRSFASWFDLTGDDELADWCRQDFREDADPQASVRQIPLRSRNRVSPLRTMTAAALGLDPESASFEIEPLFAQALGDFNVFKNALSTLGTRRAAIDEVSDRGSIIFPDGTSIVER